MTSTELRHRLHPGRAASRRGLAALGLALWLLGGCGSQQAATPAVDEHWYTFTMGGLRAGYVHDRIEQQEEDGRQVVHVRQELEHSLSRFGRPLDIKLKLHSVETP